LFLVLDLVHRRQKNDRNGGGVWIFLEPLAGFVTIHHRHHDVEQDQIRRRIHRGDVQSAFTADRDFGFVATFEQGAQQGDVVGGVVNDQNGLPFGAIVGVAHAGLLQNL